MPASAFNDPDVPGVDSELVAPIIEVHNLTRVFGKEVRAVDDLSFSVDAGEIFAFLGPNGAGKTTTIKMLTTLLRPTAGDMRVNGHDPVTEQDAVRHSFGIVFQDPSLDDELTAYENLHFHAVLYGVQKEVRTRRIEEMLTFVGLWDRRDDQMKHFSGGMKRRVEIARGLVHLPKILFLDEPTLGLDPQTRSHIWNYIRELNQREGVTVFFTTHYMAEAESVAGRAAIIDQGKIVGQGSPEELMASTDTESLEQAFLALTGHGIREEEVEGVDRMRAAARLWRR